MRTKSPIAWGVVLLVVGCHSKTASEKQLFDDVVSQVVADEGDTAARSFLERGPDIIPFLKKEVARAEDDAHVFVALKMLTEMKAWDAVPEARALLTRSSLNRPSAIRYLAAAKDSESAATLVAITKDNKPDSVDALIALYDLKYAGADDVARWSLNPQLRLSLQREAWNRLRKGESFDGNKYVAQFRAYVASSPSDPELTSKKQFLPLLESQLKLANEKQP